MSFKSVSAAVALLSLSSLGAQAADLGRPAPAAVDYVKVCDAYGAGFFYIPGSDTCLQISGYVRAEARVFSFANAFNYPVSGRDVGHDNSGSDRFQSRARADLQMDARTNTEFGLLRSMIEVYWEVNTGGAVNTNLRKAFIQWGGLTAGRTQSFFDFYLGDHYASVFETAHSDSVVNLVGYTFTFGNGFTGSISLEDSTVGDVPRRFGPNYGGLKAPDVVANLNLTQAWGSAQLMGAAHHDQSIGGGDKWGFAVGGGVTVKLPMIGAGDQWSIQAAYSEGSLSYASPDPYEGEDFNFNGGGGISLTRAWSIASGFTHNWNDKWATSLTASYLDVDRRGVALVTDDYRQFDIGGNVVWTPTTGLSIGAELEYKNVDFRGPRPSVDGLIGLVRVQRNF